MDAVSRPPPPRIASELVQLSEYYCRSPWSFGDTKAKNTAHHPVTQVPFYPASTTAVQHPIPYFVADVANSSPAAGSTDWASTPRQTDSRASIKKPPQEHNREATETDPQIHAIREPIVFYSRPPPSAEVVESSSEDESTDDRHTTNADPEADHTTVAEPEQPTNANGDEIRKAWLNMFVQSEVRKREKEAREREDEYRRATAPIVRQDVKRRESAAAVYGVAAAREIEFLESRLHATFSRATDGRVKPWPCTPLRFADHQLTSRLLGIAPPKVPHETPSSLDERGWKRLKTT